MTDLLHWLPRILLGAAIVLSAWVLMPARRPKKTFHECARVCAQMDP
jgi:hypothetical protein